MLHKAAEQPLVSFCFDDFPRSAARMGATILESLGVRATYYASMAFLEGQTDMGPGFDRRDLERLSGAGHEIGCHTFDHLDAAHTDRDAYERSIERNRIVMTRLCPDLEPRTFAYPYGKMTPDTRAIAARRFRCARGTQPGLNSGDIDRVALRANKLYARLFSRAALDSMIDENKRVPGWLVFYTHDVASCPSPFGCTPEQLRWVAERALGSGAQLVPVHEAVGQFAQRQPLAGRGQGREVSSGHSL